MCPVSFCKNNIHTSFIILFLSYEKCLWTMSLFNSVTSSNVEAREMKRKMLEGNQNGSPVQSPGAPEMGQRQREWVWSGNSHHTVVVSSLGESKWWFGGEGLPRIPWEDMPPRSWNRSSMTSIPFFFVEFCDPWFFVRRNTLKEILEERDVREQGCSPQTTTWYCTVEGELPGWYSSWVYNSKV